jgi:hypothetical protein
MVTSLPRRLALLVVLAIPLAAPSAAGATMLNIDFPSTDVVEGVPTPMHVVAAGNPRLWSTSVTARPFTPNGRCPAGLDFYSQDLLVTFADFVDVTTAAVFDHAGAWLICGRATVFDEEPSADQGLVVSVRPPHAHVAVRAPRRVAPGRSARVKLEFGVEAPRRLLYAAVRGGRCGLGADAATAQGANVVLLPGAVADGGARAVTVRFPRPGRWRVCAYVQRDDGPGAANAVAGADVSVGRSRPRAATGPPDRGPRTPASGGEFGRR